MKINPITTIIAVLMCALLSYGFYSFNNSSLRELLCGSSFVLLFTTLFFSIGTRFSTYQTNINVRTVSFVFFAVFIATNLFFSLLNLNKDIYIIVHGLALLFYLLVLYYLTRTQRTAQIPPYNPMALAETFIQLALRYTNAATAKKCGMR